MRLSAALAALFVLLASFAAPARACDDAPRPAVNITLAEQGGAAFDLTRSVAELNEMADDYYAAHHQGSAAGMMRGEITAGHRIMFTTKTENGRSCVFVERIDIELGANPSIFIASDYSRDSCKFKKIFEHEAQHAAIDREAIEKYRGRFVQGLAMALASPADYSAGWIDPAAVPRAQHEMQAGIEGALEALFEALMREREHRQREIDTPEEYNRIARACPGWG